MKQFFLIFSLPFILIAGLSAQSLEEALELYSNERYKEAAVIFSEYNDERSALFAGKSYLAIADYTMANNYLYLALDRGSESIREEALYSLSLSHFGLKNYDLSLEYLYRTIGSNNRAGLRQDARRFYTQILNYLSAGERFDTLYKLETPAIRFDLVNRSRSFLDSDTYIIMVGELRKMTTNPSTIERIDNELMVPYNLQSFVYPYPEAPIGKVYNVGVILPTFSEDDPDFTIPRNLYFGMLLAAEDYNSGNTNQKVNLLFRDSSEDPDSTAKVFNELILTKKIDAVIGPLFSEPAVRMATLAEEYRIPMLAPLANSDELNLDYNYTFQLNPTLETHGRIMAQYAVQELNLKNLAVIIEEGTEGRSPAIAFRREAERLGANITYFIEEDFASRGYDLSDATEVFTSDSHLADSLNYMKTEAIYAPFTGQASTTMMNLLLNDLEAMRNNLVILGSEAWEEAQLTDFQHRFFEIYYSQAFGVAADTSAVKFFMEDYERRFGSAPDRFSKVGYDAAIFLFRSLETAGNPVYTARALRTKPQYNGLSMRVHFNGERINQNVYIRALSNSANQRRREQ